MDEEAGEERNQSQDVRRRRLDLSATRQPVFRPPSPEESRSRKRSPSPVRRQTQSLRDTGRPRVVIETGNIRAEEDTMARKLWQRLREAANKAVVPTMLQERMEGDTTYSGSFDAPFISQVTDTMHLPNDASSIRFLERIRHILRTAHACDLYQKDENAWSEVVRLVLRTAVWDLAVDHEERHPADLEITDIQSQTIDRQYLTNMRPTQVTVEKVDEVFEYLGDYSVLVCKQHCYAVRALEDHLKRLHRTSVSDRKAIVAYFIDFPLLPPAQVLLPPPLEPPFNCLGPPKRAYICDEEECEELSVNRDVIRIHCNRVHDWRSTPEQRTYWHEQWVQTFFNAAGLQRYFTVNYEGSHSLRQIGGRVVLVDPEDNRFGSILDEWDRDLEKQKKALEIADREIAKTDHTLWFKRNEWPEHLARCNLRHLSRISRLPDKEERVLQRAVELNVAVIETCVAGLGSLDRETRRWLRSAKLSEIDQRPLARLQNPESQRTYATYFSRLLCYSLRVLQSIRDKEGRKDACDSPGESDSSSSSSSDSDSKDEGHGCETAVDVFEDARRLYPWQGRQQELLGIVQQSIERGWDDKAQMKALREWYASLIF
ncbi:uncharacterized protein LTR77_011238 [Saxophila tyrrhenica]|uniref:PD-(D/E)XK nuclease-like domain-containing protein n=1 Tax=Saxophila tyrrhenica TaxID=1690608 RepID=A0AAV9NTM6_9PEZI|nr:hypothetical protein LTR77_011238 [Saxophila tyrrhenica]